MVPLPALQMSTAGLDLECDLAPRPKVIPWQPQGCGFTVMESITAFTRTVLWTNIGWVFAPYDANFQFHQEDADTTVRNILRDHVPFLPRDPPACALRLCRATWGWQRDPFADVRIFAREELPVRESFLSDDPPARALVIQRSWQRDPFAQARRLSPASLLLDDPPARVLAVQRSRGATWGWQREAYAGAAPLVREPRPLLLPIVDRDRANAHHAVASPQITATRPLFPAALPASFHMRLAVDNDAAPTIPLHTDRPSVLRVIINFVDRVIRWMVGERTPNEASEGLVR